MRALTLNALAIALAAAVPLAATGQVPPLVPAPAPPPAPTGTCAPEGARFALGQPFTPEVAERARQAARAQVVRKIEPGGAYTMDLSPDRLNIEVDQSGTVRDLKCG